MRSLKKFHRNLPNVRWVLICSEIYMIRRKMLDKNSDLYLEQGVAFVETE